MVTNEQLYRLVDLSDIAETGESSEPLTYVGVYVLRWGKDAHPSVGFIPVESDESKPEPDSTLQEILDLARTGLPIQGYEQGQWDQHRLFRIEGMAAHALKTKEEHNGQ